MSNRFASLAACSALMLLASCNAPTRVMDPPDTTRVEAATTEVAAVLDALHAAASRADFDGYFALFAPEAVFLGTDATERWTVDEFKAFARPHFDRGAGWTYTLRPGARHIAFASGRIAYFDELIENAKYGVCRGSGVIARAPGGQSGGQGGVGPWRILQYNLAFTIPNDAANDVVAIVKTHTEVAPK